MTTQTTITGNYAKIRTGDFVTDGSGWAYEVLDIVDGQLYFAQGMPQYPTFFRVVNPETFGARGRIIETTQYVKR
jgi:hypothetical protein